MLITVSESHGPVYFRLSAAAASDVKMLQVESSPCVCACVFETHRDFDSLDEKDVEKNNQLAFDIAEKEFGISPIMTGKEMSVVVEPDKLSMVMYLSQFYEMFKDTVPPGGE